jgi:hypothetical protein
LTHTIALNKGQWSSINKTNVLGVLVFSCFVSSLLALACSIARPVYFKQTDPLALFWALVALVNGSLGLLTGVFSLSLFLAWRAADSQMKKK